MQTICAFDLGIKNLSYCVATFDVSGGALRQINRWANLNLLADGADSQSQTRCGCGGPASYSDVVASRLYCKKCAKKSAKPVLACEDMTLKGLRAHVVEIGAAEGAAAKKMKKPDVLTAIGTRRLLPYKPTKARGVSLQDILAGMEKALDVELVHMANAGRILIENQPSEFAPHMKSVQMILFALVDHRLRRERGWSGAIDFVHAKKKTAGAEIAAGKENKRARKAAGMERVRDTLAAANAGAQLAWWETQAKKDDLADALLMCLDGLQRG
jgi:hypothetical protein